MVLGMDAIGVEVLARTRLAGGVYCMLFGLSVRLIPGPSQYVVRGIIAIGVEVLDRTRRVSARDPIVPA